MNTHWIPPYTKNVGRRQLAICGTPIYPMAHSDEPTCAECKAYLVADAGTTAEDKFGAIDSSTNVAPPAEPDYALEFALRMDFNTRR